jgi:hypothetical protein
MYPQDQQPQPPNQNLMGQAPQPFNYGRPVQPPKKKGMAAWLPWAICGFLLLLVIIFGVLVLMNNNKNSNNTATNTGTSNQQNTGTSASECNFQQRRYQNQDLNIRFCYPTSWGDVKVTDSQFDPSDSGTRWLLTFASKPTVYLGLVSDDWSTDTGKTPSCANPSIQAFPDTTNFSAKWVTQLSGTQVVSATRGLEVVPDSYLLQEQVDSTTTKGVCLEGFKAFGGDVYQNAEATIYAPFSGKITTPQAHITSPTQLVSVTDRTDFTDFVKSIEKY